jgi:hypothetical protein
MRLLILTPFLVLAACSEAEQPAKTDAQAETHKQLPAGQWEMTREVTKVTQRDESAPAIKETEGSKSTINSCLAEADGKRPQPAFFVGEEMDCTSRDVYIARGRANVTLACKMAGIPGEIATIVNGTYTADAFEGTATTETSLVGEGDVKIDAKLTGRRTGECTAAPAEGEKAAKAGG